MTTTTSYPVIAAWSAVSPLGLGRAAFSDGLRAGRTAVAEVDPTWDAPVEQACLVPDFDIKAILGRKGTRSMDRATGLAVTAVGRLLDGAQGDERTALVLGTSTGSAQSIMDFTRDSLTGARPHLVDPARFPNTVMNCAAGQCAIWHKLQGPNTTIAAGRASGLLALRYALRLQRNRHADAVLVGAVEEFSHARAWLEQRARGHVALLGEGCAVLRVEPGGEGLAEVRGLETALYNDHAEVRSVVGDLVLRALRRADVDVADVALVAESGFEGEADGVRDALPGAEPVRCAEVIGDTSAASAAFQTTAVLATAEDRPELAGRAAVITSVDHDGVVAAAVLRLR
ncbi:beta-ketoacyl synthase N-terminal-like domain-containing protein [Saccharothrix algeriensis]|uniref:3-oxoacyl-ACP synthase n=1 Tax=Saccharothrix algeriensis TaxID=173560 RepID=A0A8T8I1G2_9PSEU|nr:beta-ketoacyl synthase N-terminal-like domain-containing protein [Saccharothrix algeriensis]MBM7810371.1 3-oxoacyl-[acyl-carrier-protein] synthase II [Saccharothrix algeriensis]QTR04509.1 3-oxoacyl-ACP synthase [Saccharothrix algeriensis]